MFYSVSQVVISDCTKMRYISVSGYGVSDYNDQWHYDAETFADCLALCDGWSPCASVDFYPGEHCILSSQDQHGHPLSSWYNYIYGEKCDGKVL